MWGQGKETVVKESCGEHWTTPGAVGTLTTNRASFRPPGTGVKVTLCSNCGQVLFWGPAVNAFYSFPKPTIWRSHPLLMPSMTSYVQGREDPAWGGVCVWGGGFQPLYSHDRWEELSVRLLKIHNAFEMFLERCSKAWLVTYNPVRTHATLHRMYSSWNICERDDSALMPVMILRPVKKASGFCFRDVEMIQWLRNVQRRNCYKQYVLQPCPFLEELQRRCVSMSSDINNWMMTTTCGLCLSGDVSHNANKVFSAKPELVRLLTEGTGRKKRCPKIREFFKPELLLNLRMNTRNYIFLCRAGS